MLGLLSGMQRRGISAVSYLWYSFCTNLYEAIIYSDDVQGRSDMTDKQAFILMGFIP